MVQPNPNQPGSQPASQSPASNEPKPVIFVSRAKECQIDNYRKEQWSGDHMISPAEPLRFQEHLRVTKVADEIDYIRKSGAYASNDVWEEPTMEAAMNKITQMAVEKHSTRTFDNRLETKEVVNPANIDPATMAAAMGPTRQIVNVPVEGKG